MGWDGWWCACIGEVITRHDPNHVHRFSPAAPPPLTPTAPSPPPPLTPTPTPPPPPQVRYWGNQVSTVRWKTEAVYSKEQLSHFTDMAAVQWQSILNGNATLGLTGSGEGW